MKNYYQSVEESAWPLKEIVSLEEIPNTYDWRGIAAKATLECGHHCILTGEAVTKKTKIHCKPCGEIK